ncbi:hypothetical protein FOZ62_018816, partial [Perkinsus olseni]
MSDPPLKKGRRGHRSPANAIRRKMLTALRAAGLFHLVEAVIDHGILLIRPKPETHVRYGYPVTKQGLSAGSPCYTSPPDVITPEQHYTWASSQNFQLGASFELPTMLQATVAIQRCLSPQELNWVRQHNIQALQVW